MCERVYVYLVVGVLMRMRVLMYRESVTFHR